MKALGTVKDLHEKYALVECKRSSACASCHNCEAKGACHAQLVFANDESVVDVTAENTVDAKIGDTVELESSTGKTLLVSFMTFVLPFLLSIIAFFIFSVYMQSMTALAVIFVLVFAVSFFVLIKAMNSYVKKSISFTIVKISKERE